MTTGKKPTEDGNPTAGQHTNKANVTPSLPEMASDWHRVGDGYSVAFQNLGGCVRVTWSPDVPPLDKMLQILHSDRYSVARDAFLAELVARIGKPMFRLGL